MHKNLHSMNGLKLIDNKILCLKSKISITTALNFFTRGFAYLVLFFHDVINMEYMSETTTLGCICCYAMTISTQSCMFGVHFFPLNCLPDCEIELSPVSTIFLIHILSFIYRKIHAITPMLYIFKYTTDIFRTKKIYQGYF